MGFSALLDSVVCIVMDRVTFDIVVSFVGQGAWPYSITNKPLVVWTRDPKGISSRLPPYLQDSGKCKHFATKSDCTYNRGTFLLEIPGSQHSSER